MTIFTQTMIQPLDGETGLFRIIRRGGARLILANEVRRERRALAELDGRLLADIGVSPAAAAEEAGRDFFDLPEERRS